MYNYDNKNIFCLYALYQHARIETVADSVYSAHF